MRGKVTLDGEPVAEGSIRLVALESGPTAGAPISDGHYHIRRDKGPTLGRHRVEIYVPQKSGRQIVSPMSAQRKPRTSARGVTEDFANQSAEDESQEPNLNPMQAPPMVDEWVEAAPARYNTESMLELDVQSGRNAFDVEMTSQ